VKKVAFLGKKRTIFFSKSFQKTENMIGTKANKLFQQARMPRHRNMNEFCPKTAKNIKKVSF